MRLLLILLFFCTSVYADKITDFLTIVKKGNTLQGYFSQTVNDEIGTTYESVSGQFFIKRPNKFFWQYSGEDGQKIVSTGDRVWVEQPDLENTAHASLESVLKSSPIVILLAPKTINKYFNIIALADESGFSWVDLVPIDKEQMNFEHLSVAIKDDEIKRIRINDSFGRTVTVKLIGLKYNQPIADKVFEYEPPNDFDYE